MPIFAWTRCEPDPVILHGQVPVGRGDQNMPGLQVVAVCRRPAGKLTRPEENVSQEARAVRGDVQDDADGRVQVSRQISHHTPQRLDTSRRSTHDHEIVMAADLRLRVFVHS